MIKKIKKYVKNEFGFLEEEVKENLIDTAISSLKIEKENLKNLLNSENKEEIIQSVHKIKGILLNSGLEEIAKDFEEENLAKFNLEKMKEKIKKALEKITL